jgi:ribosomal protein L17
MLRNMAVSLFLHERVQTSVAKAKELRPFAEKIITHAKHGKHQEVRRDIHSKTAFKKLFDVLVGRYAKRQGGYTQILRLGRRLGDNAELGLVRLLP